MTNLEWTTTTYADREEQRADRMLQIFLALLEQHKSPTDPLPEARLAVQVNAIIEAAAKDKPKGTPK